MWTVGPTLIPLGSTQAIDLPIPSASLRSADPPTKVQVVNNSSTYGTFQAGGLQISVPPLTAQTVPVGQGLSDCTFTPTISTVTGPQAAGYVTAVYLGQNESSPYPDGPLASPTAYNFATVLFENQNVPNNQGSYTDTVLPTLPPIYHSAVVNLVSSVGSNAIVLQVLDAATNAILFDVPVQFGTDNVSIPVPVPAIGSSAMGCKLRVFNDNTSGTMTASAYVDTLPVSPSLVTVNSSNIAPVYVQVGGNPVQNSAGAVGGSAGNAIAAWPYSPVAVVPGTYKGLQVSWNVQVTSSTPAAGTGAGLLLAVIDATQLTTFFWTIIPADNSNSHGDRQLWFPNGGFKSTGNVTAKLSLLPGTTALTADVLIAHQVLF